MSDITMCEGRPVYTTCDNCYRRTARKSPVQSWFTELPIDALGECEYYLEPPVTALAGDGRGK